MEKGSSSERQLSELLSVEDAWARLTTHIDWADRFWVAFVFTDDPRVIEALGARARAQLSAAGREYVSLRPSRSEDLDEVFETLVGGRRAGVAWLDLVRHDSPSETGNWRTTWERLMLRLNERREVLRRRWSKGGIMFATTLDRFEETPALAPDLWTIRAMALRVASLPADVGVHVQPLEPLIERRTPSVRSPQLARQAVALGTRGWVHAAAGDYLLARDCWAEALRTIRPSVAKLPATDELTIALAEDLRDLSQKHGVEVPEDLAAVVTRLLDSKDPPTRT